MDRAFLRRTQAIDACAFLARIALHGNLDSLHRNILVLRVPKHSQCLAGTQRGIVEVMGTGPRRLPALLNTEVGGKTIVSDVNFMAHRRVLISNDSNRHGFVSLNSVRGSARCRGTLVRSSRSLSQADRECL